MTPGLYGLTISMKTDTKYEPWHGISNNVVCANSKGSDQPAHMCSLIGAFAIHLTIMIIKLLTEQHLEFLNLTGGCTGSS